MLSNLSWCEDSLSKSAILAWLIVGVAFGTLNITIWKRFWESYFVTIYYKWKLKLVGENKRMTSYRGGPKTPKSNFFSSKLDFCDQIQSHLIFKGVVAMIQENSFIGNFQTTISPSCGLHFLRDFLWGI